MSLTQSKTKAVKTDVPARMDRLPWSRWHWLVIISLGITWILDGLEVTIVGAIASILARPDTLHLSDVEASSAGTVYLIGAVLGALVFGRMTDQQGRKKLFMITLVIYLSATVATAFSPNFYWFAVCRFFTGAGIGGEYAAINSAIDELIPARARGWTDLVINSTWWIGTAFGAAMTGILVNPNLFPIDIGWRLAFGLGAFLGLAVLFVRRYVPESPRWLMMHGRFEEADKIVSEIEQEIRKERGGAPLPEPEGSIYIRPRGSIGFSEIIKTLLTYYPKRSFLGFSLMTAQAFFYNAIFFTYALVLTTFYHLPPENVAFYQIPFAIGNVIGPFTIGRLFDTIGRRKMISFTYITSGVLLAITSWLFAQGVLNAITLTMCWSIIFFFASTGSSSAYLTVSEVFPLEVRALVIALFYAIGTGVGGAFAPFIFGLLIQTRQPVVLAYGYLAGAILMASAGVVAIFFGVDAERKSLESIARPFSQIDEEESANTQTAHAS